MQPSFHSATSSESSAQFGDADALDFQQFIAGQDPVEAAAAGWMIRRQDGLSAQEEAELEEWLAADPQHGAELEKLEDVWGRMDELPQDGVDALKAALPKAEASQPLPTPSPGPRRTWPGGLTQWLPPWPPQFVPRLAMLGVVIMAVGGGWLSWQTWQQQPVFTQSFATVRGQQKEITLPDGSTLFLDTATQADVTLYRHRREVRLPEGQAQFAVQSDPQKPFHVLAGTVRVTVVGTRFSVRHTSTGLDQGGVSVNVTEGRVRVAQTDGGTDDKEIQATPKDDASAVLLTAGQAIAADSEGHLGAITPSPGAEASWREGRVSFNDVPLAQVLAEFERYGPTRMVVRDPQVARLRVHGSFDLRRLDAFALALPQVLAVRLKPTDTGQMEIVRVGNR